MFVALTENKGLAFKSVFELAGRISEPVFGKPFCLAEIMVQQKFFDRCFGSFGFPQSHRSQT